MASGAAVWTYFGGPVPIAGPVAAVLCDAVPPQGKAEILPGFEGVGAKHRKIEMMMVPAAHAERGK
jgi:hypothetical protein